MKRLSQAFIPLALIISLCFCAGTLEHQKKEYGILMTASHDAAIAVKGEYPDEIPEYFSDLKFREFLKGRISHDYYEVLERYPLELQPKGTYYLLLVLDPRGRDVILFDFSCTVEVDGPVLRYPGKYDLTNIDLYDTCKGSESKN
jgi:hypothetical protein